MLAFVVVIVACSAGYTGPLPGVSTAQPGPVVVTQARPKPPLIPWPDFADAKLWPEAAPPMPALGHRRDGTLIRVRIQPESLGAYRNLARESPMPEGARIIALLEAASGPLQAAYVLEKRGGKWLPTELDATGNVVASGDAACLRCHVQAPTDHLFGVTQRAPSAKTP